MNTTPTAPEPPESAIAPKTDFDQAAGSNGYNLDDPRTRMLVEQLIGAITQSGAAPQERKASGQGMGGYVAILRRRWKPMLAIGLVAFVLLAWKLRPRGARYTATATILLPQISQSAMGGGGDSDSGMAAQLGLPSISLGASTDTQIAVLTNTTMIQTALGHMSPQMRQKAWDTTDIVKGSDRVQVSGISTVPNIINVATEARSPQAAIDFTNNLISAYLDWTQQMTVNSNQASLIQVNQQIADAEKQLLAAKQALRDYKESTKIFDIDTTLSATVAQLQELEQEAQAAHAEAEAGVASTTVLSDSTIADLQQRYNEAKFQYATVLRDFYPTAPEAKQAEQAMTDAQNLLNQRMNVLLKTVNQRASDADKAYQEEMKQAGILPKVEFELTSKNDQVALLEGTYKTLADRKTALELAKYQNGATAITLAPATRAIPNLSEFSRSLVIAAVGALFLSLLLGALLEQLDNSVHNTAELEALIHSNVLGSLPYLRGHAERRIGRMEGNQQITPMLLESLRIIRSNLTFVHSDGPPRSVLITSADPGEGKSLCALNLATVLAFEDRQVILLDCDLRRPSQHTLNDIPLEPGFSNVLSGEVTIDQALRPTKLPNLFVMPCGSLPSNAPELLNSSQGRAVIQELKERSDIVILDSPPVLSLTDAQVLSALADGVVLLIAADSTPKHHIQRAQAMLRHVGGRFVGVILNKVQDQNNPDADPSYSYYTNPDAGNRRTLARWRG